MMIKRFSILTILPLIVLLIGCRAIEVETLETPTIEPTNTPEGLIVVRGGFTVSVGDYGGEVIWEFIPLEGRNSYIVSQEALDTLPNVEDLLLHTVDLTAYHDGQGTIVNIVEVSIVTTLDE